MARIVTIIVAAGSGARMGNVIPKQFLELHDRPILMHTIENMERAYSQLNSEGCEVKGVENRFVVVLPEAFIEPWAKLCKDHDFGVKHSVIKGGDSRLRSVQNGMQWVRENVNPSPCAVLVHDGVRPFVNADVVGDVLFAAITRGSGVPVVEVVDSVRRVDTQGLCHALERSELRAVQTPQGFSWNNINNTYLNLTHGIFTDDASAVEAYTHRPVHLTCGSIYNIKITTPLDIVVGNYILDNNLWLEK